MMMAPTTHVTTGAASGVLKGDLSVVNNMLAWMDDVDTYVAQMLQEAEDQLRKDIRAEAERDPDWREVAEVIDVQYKDGAFHYVLTGDEEKVAKATALEYGSLDATPKSILRKHAFRQVRDLQEATQLEVPLA